MDVNYVTDISISNRSLKTEYYDSSTVYYSEYNSSETVTKILKETDYFAKDLPKWRTNDWALSDERYFYYNLGWTITLIVVFTLIFFIGLIGNCMVILVVIKRPQMRTVTNLFILNLAVADLLVIIFCVPTDLLYNIIRPWLLGLVGCKIGFFMKWVSLSASAYSLAAISIDRCKAIHHPQAPPRGLSKRQTYFTIGLIWTFSLTLSSPLVAVHEINDDDRLLDCYDKWESELLKIVYFLVVFVFLFYCCPLILIFISNIIIWRNVSKRKVPKECSRASRIGRMHRDTRRSAGKMLGIVTILFLLSWLPYYGGYLPMALMGYYEEEIFLILYSFASVLGCSNSCINPVLYAFMSRKFREAFKALLPKWLPVIHRTENKSEKSCSSRETITNDTSL